MSDLEAVSSTKHAQVAAQNRGRWVISYSALLV